MTPELAIAALAVVSSGFSGYVGWKAFKATRHEAIQAKDAKLQEQRDTVQDVVARKDKEVVEVRVGRLETDAEKHNRSNEANFNELFEGQREIKENYLTRFQGLANQVNSVRSEVVDRVHKTETTVLKEISDLKSIVIELAKK